MNVQPRQNRLLPERYEAWLSWALALLGPVAATYLLVQLSRQLSRDYVFIYLALVAVAGVVSGFWPAIVCAALSFLLVDFFFVPPVGTFTIADEQDIVNLLAFAVTASLVGLLASRRRRALLELEALTLRLREANMELIRLNKEQAEAAQAALRLARSEQQIRQLQEVDRLRRELLANVSHELRTPLGTILAESTAKGLDTIASEARRLEALVDDMLDMARIEGGALELHLEPLLLADVLEAAVERLQRTSPKRKVEWDRAAAGAEILADWDRVGQILDNLLSNADRYGPEGTPIELVVTTDQPGLVAVRVRDHGPGVPASLRHHVFERFVHGDDQSIGTGLGLAIVKGLVEAHAGTVTLEDTEDGACFRFTLPEAPKK